MRFARHGGQRDIQACDGMIKARSQPGLSTSEERLPSCTTRVPLLVLAVFCVLVGLPSFGCKSCISPPVRGRVADGRSGKPLPHVTVKRVNSNQDYNLTCPPKGAEVLARAPGVSTDAEGLFQLPGVWAVSPFNRAAWYSVSLAFIQPGYAPLMTTYTLADATNQLGGEAAVVTGDIVLVPDN